VNELKLFSYNSAQNINWHTDSSLQNGLLPHCAAMFHNGSLPHMCDKVP